MPESSPPQAQELTPQPKPINADRIATLGPIVEVGWKLCVAASVVLYTIGLLISNYHLQRYGHHNLELIDAQYVLVGLLWVVLTILGYAVIHTSVSVFNWPRKAMWILPWYVVKSIQAAFPVLAIGFGFERIYHLVGGAGGDHSTDARWIYVWSLCTGAVLNYSSRELKASAKRHAASLSTALLDSHFHYDILYHAAPLITAVLFYADGVYPKFNPTFGGGKLPKAVVVIDAAQASSFASAGLPVSPDGNIGQWYIVAYAPDELTVTNEGASRLTDAERQTFSISRSYVKLIRYVALDEDRNNNKRVLEPSPRPAPDKVP